ncbi:hypothetical protein ACFVHS_44555 [Streptomyces sp. NPDC057746]|uniref:hypothetical protein n=1 Tax=Streptomyces sp. NPDC057746 TaxID=3346237 RepID=UPI003698BDE6
MGRALLSVVRDVVITNAPEELPLVVGLNGLDDAEIGRRLARGRTSDEPLGFGAGEAVALVTSVVWMAIQTTANEVVGAAAQGALGRLRVTLRRMFRRTPSPAPLPHFGRRELAEVHRRVLELARDAEMDPSRAAQLADSVISRLVLDTAGDSGE